ncbi:MAG: N-acetyl-gamma-glutamyl-phosphate reductase [Caldilineaceae bacterium]|nr:N-acetyl-gamma-glutamyl-phosphate reductase [Caldilineaceae bacterium]
MYKAGIAGATGYTGIELVGLIHRHPHLEIGWVTSESKAGSTLSDVHAVPWNYPLISLEDGIARANEVDVVFLCLPHAASIEPVRAFQASGVRVIDLSADFRLVDQDIYKQWYHTEHTAPELLSQFVYGLCEIYREQIKGAQLIANPGCYPTTVNLGLYPLAKAGWLGKQVIVDSKSGTSGAGRKASLPYSFVEVNENFYPYNIGYRHRHIAEMEQVLNHATPHGQGFQFLFSPHLLPINRGILSTMYVTVTADVSEGDIRHLYAETYANEPFIHLLPAGQLASIRHTAYTNRCAISLLPANPQMPKDGSYIIVVSEDNLIKGASGQAIQNFNIAAGLNETDGLL